ncbi:LPS export ABC transporter permease LptF [Xaviernesmea oryzae]|uniref:LPS export ABC transporter permease LptF n=1 Tax=Xaviernesmea oryzae TaxID=464029 RepID=A0A1Q9AT24_9HYPH|nr:LPS export ABC transporter permease LptF [Xaviernesmea oryzae]OLP58536.1 LPS export ABC transporter permease LptF [Xaviernesmea oryzae]SEK61064.1 lipopolysaccharide export system permease protein [Xaviernesmea oryzae]
MSILESYILRRVLQMFLTALLPVLGIIWTTQALQRINLVTDTGQSIGAFLQLATLILPTVIPLVLPFALAIGITQTLGTMNNDSELTVIEAGGGARSIVLRPILILAAALCLVSFFVDNVIEPMARHRVREMIASANADLLGSIVQENTFRRIGDDLYIQIAGRRGGGVLTGIFVADSRDPAVEFIYYAREGAVDEKSSALVMKDGEVHRKLPDGGVSIIKFDSYAFDLTEMTRKAGNATLRAQDRTLGYLLHPDPEDEQFQRKPLTFTAELHRRLTEWTFPMIFALVSLVVASDARSHREARLHPTASALLLVLLFRWMTFYSANGAEDTPYFIPLMYLIPIATAILCIRQLFGSKRLTLPRKLQDKTADLAARARKIGGTREEPRS